MLMFYVKTRFEELRAARMGRNEDAKAGAEERARQMNQQILKL